VPWFSAKGQTKFAGHAVKQRKTSVVASILVFLARIAKAHYYLFHNIYC
jgi:hypothetical protein